MAPDNRPRLRVRPGTPADIPVVARIYLAAFADEMMLQRCHPKREEYPDDFIRAFEHLFQARYWGDEQQIFSVAVTDSDARIDHPSHSQPNRPSSPSTTSNRRATSPYSQPSLRKAQPTKVPKSKDRIIAFSWFRRPWQDPVAQRAHEGPLTPRGWLKPIHNTRRRITTYLWPCRSADPNSADVFSLIHDSAHRRLVSADPNPPRRLEAWYLSTVAVDPAMQGCGAGSLLVRDALAGKVDVEDGGAAACWLVGLRGVEAFYEKFGFEVVGRANEGDLADWDGGAIMVRD